MLYHGNNPILRITGVEAMTWSKGTYFVAPREYSALAFRIRGTARITAGNEVFSVRENDVLYLPQRMPYTAHYTDTELLVIHFATLETDRKIEIYNVNNSEEIYKLFLRAHALWQEKEPGYALHVLSRLYAILGTVFEKEAKNVLPPHFLRAISYINSHYRENTLSVDAILKDVGMSGTTFRQLFRRYYEKTPVQYIADLRVEYARNLIAGGVNVELAATAAGFSDPKYFARVVKKRFQCTPRDFKTYGK